MDPMLIMGLLALGLLAGAVGALFGVGGGIIFIPVLTIVFGLTATEAVAVSLIGIITTSTSGAASYTKEHTANIRIGLLLEISTSAGAIVGAMIAVYIDNRILMVMFALVMIAMAARILLTRKKPEPICEDGEFSFVDPTGREMRYDIRNVPTGFAASAAVGAIASMTGVGGGVMKVPIMNDLMGVPMRSAVATSSYMIGITSFAGAIVYFFSGELLLVYAGLVAISSFFGAKAGVALSKRFDSGKMKRYFSAVIIISAALMLLQAGGLL